MQTALWKGRAFSFAVRWRCVCCSLAWFPKRPSPSFLSESLWLSIERAFKFKGLYFDFVYISSELFLFSGFATTASRTNSTRSRCATTWLTTLPSGGYSAAPLPSSPETGLTSHCESDKLSLLSLVRMTLTRNNHCERGLTRCAGQRIYLISLCISRCAVTIACIVLVSVSACSIMFAGNCLQVSHMYDKRES